MITWNQTQINISTPLPQVSSTMTFVTPYTFRYYYNVCTFGYSAVWCVTIFIRKNDERVHRHTRVLTLGTSEP